MYRAIIVAAVGLALAVAGPAAAQGDLRLNGGPDRFLILMQGHRLSSLSGSGLSSAFGVEVADVGGVNPVALGDFDRAAVGVTYQLETSIGEGYFAGIGYEPMNGARPQSAAVVLPLGDFAFGVSYTQRYVAQMDFGAIPVTTGGAPLQIEASQSARLETVSPQFTYRAALRDGGLLTLGARLGLGHARLEAEIDENASSFTDWGTQAALGVSYRRAGAYGLALYYESALRVGGTLPRFLPGPDLPSPIEGETIGYVTIPQADAIPARLGASVEIVGSPVLQVGADLTRVFWRDAWGGGEELRDNSEAAFWTRFGLSRSSAVSLGLLAQGRDRWNNGITEIYGYSGRAIYITLGAALTFGPARLDAVVADSRLLSGNEQRQTVVKAGASVGL